MSIILFLVFLIVLGQLLGIVTIAYREKIPLRTALWRFWVLAFRKKTLTDD